MRKHRRKGSSGPGTHVSSSPHPAAHHHHAHHPGTIGAPVSPSVATTTTAGGGHVGTHGTTVTSSPGHQKEEMVGMSLSIREKQTTALRAIYCTLLQGVDYYYTKSHQHHQQQQQQQQQQVNQQRNHSHSPHQLQQQQPATHHQHHSHHHHHQHHPHQHQQQQHLHHAHHPPHHHQDQHQGQHQQQVHHLLGHHLMHHQHQHHHHTSCWSGTTTKQAQQQHQLQPQMQQQQQQLTICSSPSSPTSSHPSPSLSPSSLSSVSSSSSYSSSDSSSSKSRGSSGSKDCKNTSLGKRTVVAAGPFPLVYRSADLRAGRKVTTPRPPARPWLTLGTPTRNKPSCLFTVMSYNILCDKYATRQTYGYCPSWALAWEYRRKTIMDEVKNYSADIICMQELETEQFYSFFLPELSRDGYDGIFSPKSRAKTMSENDRKHVDGVAIFYRKRKFSLLKKHLVEFNQMAMSNAEGCDDMLNRVMTKDNVGLAALLQTKEGAFDESNPAPDSNQVNQPILVCTSHLHWDPEYCDVKLIQTMMLMHELRTMLEDSVTSFRPGATKADPNSVPLLFCCDLNSTPDSGVIEFLATGRVAADHVDFKGLGYQDCLKRLSSTESSSSVSSSSKGPEFAHPFKIACAYADGSIPFTNYSFDFKGVLDYVFYSKTRMSVMGILGPLDMTWLQEYKVPGFPHPHVPSDHLPLLVELELTA